MLALDQCQGFEHKLEKTSPGCKDERSAALCSAAFISTGSGSGFREVWQPSGPSVFVLARACRRWEGEMADRMLLSTASVLHHRGQNLEPWKLSEASVIY